MALKSGTYIFDFDPVKGFLGSFFFLILSCLIESLLHKLHFFQKHTPKAVNITLCLILPAGMGSIDSCVVKFKLFPVQHPNHFARHLVSSLPCKELKASCMNLHKILHDLLDTSSSPAYCGLQRRNPTAGPSQKTALV